MWNSNKGRYDSREDSFYEKPSKPLYEDFICESLWDI